MPTIPPDHLRISIAIAMRKVRLSKNRSEDERLKDELAKAVVEGFERAGWTVSYEETPGHSIRLGLEPW